MKHQEQVLYLMMLKYLLIHHIFVQDFQELIVFELLFLENFKFVLELLLEPSLVFEQQMLFVAPLMFFVVAD
jgi:hypothetical protein